MNAMDINIEGDGAWPDLKEKMEQGKVIHLCDTVIGLIGLEGGMQSGAPSVAMRLELPDGRTVMFETSLRLFLLAADAFRARFGTPKAD